MTAVNLAARCRASIRNRVLRHLQPGDWVRVSYWHADAQILAAGPVTAVDDDGVWIDVLRVGRGVHFTEIVADRDMPILGGAVLAPREVRVGYHVAVIQTYAEITSQMCGYVTGVEASGFWVGGNWVKVSRRDDNGRRRGLTIKRLSVSEDDIYEIRISPFAGASGVEPVRWIADIWYMSSGVGPELIVNEAAADQNRDAAEAYARNLVRKIHRRDGTSRLVINVVEDSDRRPPERRNGQDPTATDPMAYGR